MNPEPLKGTFIFNEVQYLLLKLYANRKMLEQKGEFYDKISKKKLSKKIAFDRWNSGLKNTMFFVICYNDFNKAFEDVVKVKK